MQACLVYIERVYIRLQRDGCPDRSPCNNVLIRVETDFDARNEISVFHSFSLSVQRPGILAFLAF